MQRGDLSNAYCSVPCCGFMGLALLFLPSPPPVDTFPTIAWALSPVLGISAGELIDGRRVSPETQRIMNVWDSLPQERRRALLQFLSV